MPITAEGALARACTIARRFERAAEVALQVLAEHGVTRVSFGMQSALPHVLAVLDRTHDPRRVPGVVGGSVDVMLSLVRMRT